MVQPRIKRYEINETLVYSPFGEQGKLTLFDQNSPGCGLNLCRNEWTWDTNWFVPPNIFF